jgi:O-antigen ligase
MMALKTWFLPTFLCLCVLLGGASAAGYTANLALQLIAIGILVWAFSAPTYDQVSPGERGLLFLLAAAGAILAIQFVPLPSVIWDMLGQRAEIASMASQIGAAPTIKMVSLIPHQTLSSAVWLLPALAVALFMLRLRHYRRKLIPWTILAVTVLSIIMGALQVTGGSDGPWYLYDVTNPGSPVGFFANSNHQTTLLLISLPFLAAAVSQLLRKNSLPRAGVWIGGSVGLLLLLIGIVMNGSLAGYFLALPVLAASILILVPAASFRRLSVAFLGVMSLTGIVLNLATDEGGQLLTQSSNLSPEGREAIFANTWRAAQDFMPLGSGIGSFQDIYPLYENPAEATLTFINNAHNDYLQLFLETGLLGALLVALFLLWWIRQATRIWSAVSLDPVAGAAVVATAAVLVHSLVDYPLRTAAISSLFMLCCVLMASRPLGKQLSSPPASRLISQAWDRLF